MKKYTRYYSVTFDDHISYRKIQSDLPFSIQEGKDSILKNKDVKSVQTIAKSKVPFLGIQ